MGAQAQVVCHWMWASEANRHFGVSKTVQWTLLRGSRAPPWAVTRTESARAVRHAVCCCTEFGHTRISFNRRSGRREFNEPGPGIGLSGQYASMHCDCAVLIRRANWPNQGPRTRRRLRRKNASHWRSDTVDEPSWRATREDASRAANARGATVAPSPGVKLEFQQRSAHRLHAGE
jgi:hypothetical protein